MPHPAIHDGLSIQPRPFLALWVLLVLAFVPATSCAAERPLPESVRRFLESHCYACHDNATARAKLSLESLEPRFTGGRWVRVHDRIAAGEMPPKKSKQPSEAERKAVTAWLNGELHAASLARQKAEGRVRIRRLNRTEYEHTLHDLLGITVPLKGLLPEDTAVGGFDTVSSGLETSATHLVRYQEAAERALDAALPGLPMSAGRVRLTGREYLEGRPKPNRDGVLPWVRYAGDTLVLYATLYKHGSACAPSAPSAGRYRVRASVRALNTAGHSIPVLLGRISSDRFAHEKLQHLIDIQDAPANKSRVIEVELALPQGEQVYLEGQGLPFFGSFKKKPDGSLVGDISKGPGLAVEWVELEGPLDPGLGYRRLFGELPQVPLRYADDAIAGKPIKDDWKKWNPGEFSKYPLVPISRDPKADSARLMRAFLPRAFRRPMEKATADYFVRFVHNLLDEGERFDIAMRAGYKAVLCSPFFLFYSEKPGRLDDYAVAARLARFLWGSMPDDELTNLAAKGELSRPEILRAQTERLLADAKARRFTEAFTGLWLDLAKFGDMKPDGIYAEFDENLAWSMPLETVRFFEEILTRDLSVTNFVHSDWTFLNARLARHYGIADVEGMELRRVALPADSHRGGVITHGSVLKVTTNATYTSPIKRGAWILDRIIGAPPPPPPPDVEAIEPDIRGSVTIREQLARHKAVPVCASCHVHIDPPGFALENFDVVGGWRESYRVSQGGDGNRYVELPNYPGRKVWLAKPVDASGETSEGRRFANIDEYKRIVLADPDQIARNLARKLAVYSTGAEIQFADREVIEGIVGQVRAKDRGLRSIVHAVVQSRIFLHK